MRNHWVGIYLMKANGERMSPLAFGPSALVVAHPDDEILWFSSVLAHVDRGFICFEECDEVPALGAARREVMAAYPLGSMSWLRHAEPCSFGHADWTRPVESSCGMALNARSSNRAHRRKYEASYQALRGDLRERLVGYRHVFSA